MRAATRAWQGGMSSWALQTLSSLRLTLKVPSTRLIQLNSILAFERKACCTVMLLMRPIHVDIPSISHGWKHMAVAVIM